MSKTFNEKHPTTHSKRYRFPNPFRDRDGNIWRNRKMRPYGDKGWKGYGGETYFHRFGELLINIVSKKWARRKSKKIIDEELYE